MTWLVPLLVLVPLLGAAVALGLLNHQKLQRAITVVVLVVALAVAATLMVLVDHHGTIVVQVGGWEAPYGISLVVDRLSALLLTVSASVLLIVLLFSIGQGLAADDGEAPVTIFYPTYLVLAAGVLDSFIAGDLFNLYVAFEMLLVASYVLITLGGSEQRVRAGTTYIVTSLIASAIFLAAIGLVYGATGTVNIAQISERMAALPEHVQLLLHTMLLIGFGIKAAVFPLAFWLPDSYPTAPAPVTAVFAGLLTKVGIYAIIRLETIIFPRPQLNTVLLIVAILTMLVGVLGAVSQTDVKRLLSFTLISHIGFMVMGVGLGSVVGTAAAVFYTVHHIVVQTTLFLVSGLMERVGGTTSTRSLGGLLKAAPLLAALYLVPAFNLGGIPPFSGFIGKLGLFRAAALDGSPLAYVTIGAGVVTSLLTLYALMRVWDAAFWRPRPAAEAAAPHASTAEPHAALRSPEPAPLTVSEETGKAFHPGGSTTVTDAPHASSASSPHTAPTETQDGVGEAPARVRLPRMLVGVTTVAVLGSVALTVVAGPLYGYATRAAESLESPTGYVQAVLGGTTR
ncbi:Na+/H+ antiporter subunit D [Curtobacterium sp. SP.BCo]|uniref:Na+/H+ antiporter subunit D n=1 Tax=Curtobacterium sp. SP.BCo TaxID=3435229 RepID=UPI003F738D67